ncbi:MAG: EamA/RhaT family transporter, partial [Gammaproteobacteria bacterium]|nr:EamA/RhaT family transporter [Gammaproteobacteria bacterium]NIM74193.1 EamA/RhaT family transporter [Gammaproteobacteria bacterium]NIN39492.1 EamA/RhaT family transporter [Gammaproteobacteria bacterium]NIO25965.1 EamA/RhaT family transporter [Gammaproteobacteria bacterium]NIO66598.1 EamA/RhaT family transporter [Gammaproteobacteria bacterium]
MKRILFPLTTSVLFSGSYIAGKYTTVDLDPLTATLLRYFVALLFLTLLLVCTKKTLPRLE